MQNVFGRGRTARNGGGGGIEMEKLRPAGAENVWGALRDGAPAARLARHLQRGRLGVLVDLEDRGAERGDPRRELLRILRLEDDGDVPLLRGRTGRRFEVSRGEDRKKNAGVVERGMSGSRGRTPKRKQVQRRAPRRKLSESHSFQAQYIALNQERRGDPSELAVAGAHGSPVCLYKRGGAACRSASA